MLKKFDEYVRTRGIQSESFKPETPKNSQTIDGKDVAGLKEVIEIEGLGKMKVKLDSGNTAMNALIVQDYYEDKDTGTVKFDFNGEEKKYDVVKHIRIWHHGKSTERPVIKVNIKFNGKIYKDELVDLKISDLSGDAHAAGDRPRGVRRPQPVPEERHPSPSGRERHRRDRLLRRRRPAHLRRHL